MTKKILKSIILLSVLNVLISSVIVLGFLQQCIMEQNSDDLKKGRSLSAAVQSFSGKSISVA